MLVKATLIYVIAAKYLIELSQYYLLAVYKNSSKNKNSIHLRLQKLQYCANNIRKQKISVT